MLIFVPERKITSQISKNIVELCVSKRLLGLCEESYVEWYSDFIVMGDRERLIINLLTFSCTRFISRRKLQWIEN